MVSPREASPQNNAQSFVLSLAAGSRMSNPVPERSFNSGTNRPLTPSIFAIPPSIRLSLVLVSSYPSGSLGVVWKNREKNKVRREGCRYIHKERIIIGLQKLGLKRCFQTGLATRLLQCSFFLILFVPQFMLSPFSTLPSAGFQPRFTHAL